MCRDCGFCVNKKENLCLRGVVCVEDLEKYLKLNRDDQKGAKLRVTFFGEEAQTLVGLSARQVMLAEKDFWWYRVFFVGVDMRALLLYSQTVRVSLWWI